MSNSPKVSNSMSRASLGERSQTALILRACGRVSKSVRVRVVVEKIGLPSP